MPFIHNSLITPPSIIAGSVSSDAVVVKDNITLEPASIKSVEKFNVPTIIDAYIQKIRPTHASGFAISVDSAVRYVEDQFITPTGINSGFKTGKLNMAYDQYITVPDANTLETIQKYTWAVNIPIKPLEVTTGIPSGEVFGAVSLKQPISVNTSINTSVLNAPVCAYEQTLDVISINTIRNEKNITGITVGHTEFLQIPDAYSIQDFASSYVGVGLRILEIIDLAGKYIGAYITPPTTRPDFGGGVTPLLDGDMIYDRFYKTLRVWNDTDANWETYVFQNFPDYFRTGLTPTRIDDDTFTIPYDMTSIYSTSKRLRFEDETGDIIAYASINDSSHATGTTTVNVTMDSGVIPNPLKWADISNVPAPGWTLVTSPSTEDLHAVATGSIGATEVYFAGGLNGAFYKSNDGSNWTNLTGTIPNMTGTILSIVYHSYPQNFWAITATHIFNTTDGITWSSWSNDDPVFQSYGLRSGSFIAPAPNSNNVYLRGNSSRTYTTSDMLATTFADQDIYGSEELMVINDYNNYFLMSEFSATQSAIRIDSNHLFSSSVELVSARVNDITFMYSSGFLAVCDGGAIYKGVSTTGDATSKIPAANSGFGVSNINSVVWNSNFNVAIAVADNGKIATSHDFGATWIQRANPFAITDKVMDVCYNEDQNLYVAVGDQGKIAVSTNGVS